MGRNQATMKYFTLAQKLEKKIKFELEKIFQTGEFEKSSSDR